MEEQLKTAAWGAEYLGVTYARFCDLCHTGVLPVGVVGGVGRQLRVNPARLREFVSSGGRALPGGWRREPATVA